MKLSKYNLNYTTGVLTIQRAMEISIDSSFNKNNIPILRDIINIDTFTVRDGIFENEYISISVSDFNGYGAVMQKIAENIFVETVLSRFISLLLRRAHLKELSKSLSMSYIGKQRVQTEIEDLDALINDLSKSSALSANVVLRVVDMSGAQLIWQSVDPLASVFGNAISSSTKEYVDADGVLQFVNGGLPDEAFNLVMSELTDKFNSEKKLLLPPKIFGGKLDFANATLNLDVRVLKFLCNNRHLLSTCSDVCFNLMLVKEDYSSNELFARGSQLKSILYEMSVRFPFLRDNKINRREIILDTGDLLNNIFESSEYSEFRINDVDQVSVISTSKSLSTMYRSLTRMQCLQLAYLSSHMNERRLTFPNSSYLELEDCEFVRILENKFSLVPHVIAACNAITAVVMCGMKINSSNSSTFSLDIRNFLIRLDPNFSLAVENG